MARVHFFALLFLVAIGLSCGKKSDEEVLRERIDSTPVHLYLATKIAILKADQSPEARAAHDALMRAIAALRATEGPSGERRPARQGDRRLPGSGVQRARQGERSVPSAKGCLGGG